MYVLSLPIIARKQIAKDTTEVVLGLADQKFMFEPGQYVRVTLGDLVTSNPKGNWRDLTITSSPEESGELRIIFRNSQSDFKKSLLEMPLGTKVQVTGPHGRFTLPRETSRPLVFVAGGSGITAFLSKILESAKRNHSHEITLLWGEQEEERSAYFAKLEEIALLSGGRFKVAQKIGGTIDEAFIREHVPNFSDQIWQVAGPPTLVSRLKKVLRDLDIQEEKLSFVEYSGYGKEEGVTVEERGTHDRVLREMYHPSDQERFHALLEALNKTAIVSETDKDGNIIYVNDKFTEVSKYGREELIGQNHRLLKSGFHDASFYKELWETISGGGLWRGELKNMAKDGSYYWVDTSIIPIMHKGKPVKYVSVRFVVSRRKEVEEELTHYHRDLEALVSERTAELAMANTALQQEITVRKQLEDSLRARADSLTEVDVRKNTFLALLSHELRNPLTPIVSSVEAIKLRGISDPELQDSFDTIERQAKHLALLLRDLLDVTRVNMGKIVLRKEIVSLSAILDGSIETAKPFIERWGHTLEISGPNEEITLFADPVRLEQVIVNILNNAGKYTQPGGQISLVTERDKEDVVIRIRDSGIGIAPDMLPHLFEAFVQVEHPKSRATGGLGLGLSLVKTFTEMHGGSVTANSRGVGEGSEFTLRFPVYKESAQDSASTTGVPQGKMLPQPKRILVTDDNQDLANALSKLLRLLGHEVQTAYSGSEAIKLANVHKPDFIFMDIAMPEMDGYEAARALRKEAGLTNATLVALTGYGQEKDRERAKEAGFSYHLVKPVGVEEIRKILRGEAAPLSTSH